MAKFFLSFAILISLIPGCTNAQEKVSQQTSVNKLNGFSGKFIMQYRVPSELVANAKKDTGVQLSENQASFFDLQQKDNSISGVYVLPNNIACPSIKISVAVTGETSSNRTAILRTSSSDKVVCKENPQITTQYDATTYNVHLTNEGNLEVNPQSDLTQKGIFIRQ